MIRIVEELCYDTLAMAGIERIVEGHKPKKAGIELIMDNEIGPDVRYVMASNNIDLVKQFMMGPITPAEFRELRHKLLELRGQQISPEDIFVRSRFSKEFEFQDIRPSDGDQNTEPNPDKRGSEINVIA